MSCSLRSIFSTSLLSVTVLCSLVCFEQAAANQLPVIDVEAWAEDVEITSPARRTILHVGARPADETPNPLTYRWLQVGGPPSGNVRFSPNDDASADTTTAVFSGNVSGKYTLRVIVSDGLRESISQVEVHVEATRRGAENNRSKFRPERRGERTIHTRIDRVIVRFERDAGPGDEVVRFSARSEAVLESLGATVTKTWMQGRLGLVECTAEMHDRAALDRFLTALEALPEIRYAEPDDSIELNYLPNDPRFGEQWGLENPTGVNIGATLAWDQTTGSPTTLVAVMDSGVDYTHPDLYLAIAINNGEIPTGLLGQIVDTNSNELIDFYDLNSLDANGNVVLDGLGGLFNQALTTDSNANGYIDAEDLRVPAWMDGIDGDNNGYLDDLTGWDSLNDSNDPMDIFGHGTHATGILAARGDNGLGIAGVNWRARILPERFWATGGASTANAIQAIDHAVLLGADVINASWGTFSDSIVLQDAIQFAGDNDVVVVAAAGNHSNDIDILADAYYPAAYTNIPNLISVASVDPDGSLSSFSNFGLNSVDIAAPGASVLSTEPGGGYAFSSGTSWAVPHVAGTVALLAGLFPGQTADWLVTRVLSTATPLPDLTGKVQTGGMLDAFAAVNTPSIAGPRIVVSDPIGDVVGSVVNRVVLTFDSVMSAGTFATDDIELDGPSGPIIPTAVNPLTDFVFEVVFPSQSEAGLYSLTAGPEIEDDLGRLMDQDRDGTAGEAIEDRFNVVFIILPPPTSWIIDDGSAGYSTIGSWSTYTRGGAQGDFDYKVVDSGLGTAEWTLGGLTPGDYRVSVTWEDYPNRADDTPYTVLDGSTSLGTVPVDQRTAPADFVDAGVDWHDLGIYSLTSDTLSVRLSDLAGPAGSLVIADAVRVEALGAPILAPEVRVLVDGVDVPDGTGFVDFGNAILGTPVSKTLMVANLGTLDLALGSITVPAGYTLVSGFGSTLLAPGQTTNFVVQLDASTEGTDAGVISFDSNDANENPFDFIVSGTVLATPPPIWTIDDGDPGYSATAGWTVFTGSGAQGDFDYKLVGSGTETATWTLSGLTAGEYRVSATWDDYPNRTVDAAYTVLDGSTALATVPLDQRLSPADFVEDGVLWQDLGVYPITGDTVVVELSDLATPPGSIIVADAVRVERIGPLPSGPEVSVSIGATPIADGTGSVDFGTTALGIPVTQTLTVANVGASDLSLGAITLPAGYSLVSGFGSTLLTPGQTTDFVVQFDAVLPGNQLGVMSFGSNDTDENPYDVTLVPEPGLVAQLAAGVCGLLALRRRRPRMM